MLLIVLLGSLAPVPLRAEAPEAVWPWPVPVDPPAITGTFMEPRSGGYHAGLDIRTQGRTGLPVRSPVDGWVARIRTSPRGYGKALYLRTDDGLTLVFAHLERFHAPVQELLRREMLRTGRYRQDLHPEPGSIRVSAGEVIALSGDTGTGAPHLHLEVRGRDGRPRNPVHWLLPPDALAPEIRALRLVPLVGGVDEPRPARSTVVDPRRRDRVPARGVFALQVDVRDRTGHSPFTVAPLGVALRVDGEESYRVVQRAFDFSRADRIHLEIQRDDGGRWLRLQRREGMDLDGREGEGGPLSVLDRPREVEVVAWDHAGHRDSVRVRLDPGLADPDPEAPQGPALDLDENFLVVELPRSRAPELRSGPFHFALAPGEGRRVLPLAEIEAGGVELWDGEELLVRRMLVPAGRPAVLEDVLGTGVRLADREGRAAHPGGGLALHRVEADLPPSVDALAPVLEVEAVAVAFRNGYELSLTRTREPEHVVWLQQAGEDEPWKALATDVSVEEDGSWRIRASLDGSGRYVAVVDRRDPRILSATGGEERDGVIHLHWRGTDGPHGLPRPGWPAVRVRIEDDGSGLPDTSPEVFLDGRRHPGVWDPERATLVLDWFVDPGPGRHEVAVVARDRSGRTHTRSFVVEMHAAR